MRGLRPLVVRADADSRVGLGHVMRSLAVAQAFKNTGRGVIVASHVPNRQLASKWLQDGIEVESLDTRPGSVEDARWTVDIAKRYGAKWVMIDGYSFDAEFQKYLKNSGLRILSVDDYGHASHYHADIVVNQNVYANERLYEEREPYTELLLGPRFVMLRKEFDIWQRFSRETPMQARKLLVTLGGADWANVTSTVIEGLKKIRSRELESIVVVGALNSHYEKLTRLVQDGSRHINIRASVEDMPRLMAWADMAVSAGGSTCYEMAYMRLPSIAVVLAENQRAVVKGLEDLGVLRNLGWFENCSATTVAEAVETLLGDECKRFQMAAKGREIVDGKGVKRIRNRLIEQEIQLRRATREDSVLLWKWANEQEVRQASFESEVIEWDVHERWFRSRMSDENCLILIAVGEEGQAIGQARFEKNEGDIVISVSVNSKFRGLGYGESVISKASRKALNLLDGEMIHAYIKIENETSSHAFRGAGYKDAGLTTFKGCSARHFTFGEEVKVESKN